MGTYRASKAALYMQGMRVSMSGYATAASSLNHLPVLSLSLASASDIALGIGTRKRKRTKRERWKGESSSYTLILLACLLLVLHKACFQSLCTQEH